MSLSFRPVNEVWGEHSSCFVHADLLLRVLHEIATAAGTGSQESTYGDKTSVWIESGSKFLDFIRSERAFTADRIARMLGLKRNLNDLKSLVSSMQVLADSWQTSIDAHGALTFYIDAY
jgi:hypothetical protein